MAVQIATTPRSKPVAGRIGTRSQSRSRSRTLAWAAWLVAALLATLPAAAQEAQKAPATSQAAPAQPAFSLPTPAPAAPAFVIWTTIRPSEGASRALAEWVADYEKNSPEAPVAVRFIGLDEKAEQWATAPEPDLPPDAYLATDAELLALAQAGRLASLDDAATKALAADPAHIEAVALERVTSDGRLWALPLCADMTVEYVNTNRPTAGEGPAGDWAGFAAGKYSRWRGASDHARALLESATAAAKSAGSAATPPVPGWKVLSAPPGGEELGRKSLRVWAVALAAKSPKPRERALAVALSLESGKTIDRLLGAGGKLPVHRFGQVQAYLRQLHFEGPWLDAWAAKSPEMQPQAR